MESGTNKKTKILLISSANPTVGPGRLALDYYEAFKSFGYAIDLLTKYKSDTGKNSISVFPQAEHFSFYKVCAKIKRRIGNLSKHKPEYYFFHKNDNHPPVRISKVLGAIKTKYDLVIILFWQELLSVKTVEKIYDKLQCPIFFRAVDYYCVTGGCHFFHSCNRFMQECGCCPAWSSHNQKDFTNKNILYRVYAYSKIKPIMFCNKYVGEIMRKSTPFRNGRIENAYPIINENDFCPMDKGLARAQYNILPNKSFIILFGCQSLSDERKGMKYLFEALDIWHKTLSTSQIDQIQIISIGKSNGQLKASIPFDYLELGFVTFSALPSLYSMANVYLSPSVVDAGPMMVNQALSCGTPVVAFEIGTALEVVRNQGTGYCAVLKDAKDFETGINGIYSLSASERMEISKQCRRLALKTTSYKASIESIMNVYKSLMDVE